MVSTDLQIEDIILRHLIHMDAEDIIGSYAGVIQFLDESYFDDVTGHKHLLKKIKDRYTKYTSFPSFYELEIDNEKLPESLETTYKSLLEKIKKIKRTDSKNSESFLMDRTEKFCKERALYLALAQSIKLKDHPLDSVKIPDLLSAALNISFDKDVGLDYVDDPSERWERLHAQSEKIPFDIDILNDITGYGFDKKTLNIFMAPPGVGKSAIMCHIAGSYVKQMKNVLYVTMEMSEEKIGQRIDANLFNIPINDVLELSKRHFLDKYNKLKVELKGKLIIKEFAPGTCSSQSVYHLMGEIEQKTGIVFDALCLDYLNIARSDRVSLNQGSYLFIKSICEEFRALAQKKNIVVVSATQTNREGMDNSDYGVRAISESTGLVQTADFLAGFISSDDRAEVDTIILKQLKSRYNSINLTKKILLGYERIKNRFFDVNQEDITGEPDTPSFDKGFGGRMKEEATNTQSGSFEIKW